MMGTRYSKPITVDAFVLGIPETVELQLGYDNKSLAHVNITTQEGIDIDIELHHIATLAQKVEF